MIKTILIPTVILMTFNTQAFELFKADYEVFKDGKKIGTSSTELTKNASNFKITDKADGTHGMASFLGFRRSEVTVFTENNNNFVPNSYQMKQKVAFNKRYSEYQIDEQKQMVYGVHKGNEWQMQIPTNFSTPNLVGLNLSQDICKGKKLDLNYQIVKDGKIQSYSFKIITENDGIIEVDKIHSKPSRITKTWLDKKQKCLPVKTYHVEKGEDPLETKLIKLALF